MKTPYLRDLLAILAFLLLSAVSCGQGRPADSRVNMKYDAETGKLVQVTLDEKNDGKPNIYSYMDGSHVRRIEIDKDEDGKIDRWEFYGTDQKLEKVGLSRLNDGKNDMWVYSAPDGSIERVETSTHRDRKIDRREFYAKGLLLRAETDSDGDGKTDKWETYREGALASVSFDTNHSGKPTTTVDYDRDGVESPAK